MKLYQKPERVMNPFRNYCVLVALLFVGLLTGGCVSSTLNSAVESEASTHAENQTPNYDPAAREQAVAEMRAKAAESSTEKTNAFANQDGPARPLTASEANAKIRALSATSSELATTITDEELEAKQRSIAELKRKAKSHYSDALRKIEN